MLNRSGGHSCASLIVKDGKHALVASFACARVIKSKADAGYDNWQKNPFQDNTMAKNPQTALHFQGHKIFEFQMSLRQSQKYFVVPLWSGLRLYLLLRKK